MKLITEFLHELVQFAYAIGFFSELMITIIVVYVVYSQIFNHIVYLVGFVLCVHLNRWLKRLIRDKRPDHPVKFLAAEKFKTSKTDNFFGMPSGHSQAVAYSIVYLYKSIGQVFPWVAVCVFIGLLMILERWWFRNHTLLQLTVGIVVGALYGQLVVSIRDMAMLDPVRHTLDQFGGAF